MSSDVPASAPAPVSRLVAGVAVLGAVVLLAGVAVSARGEDPADTDTTVAAVSTGALLVTSTGSRPAHRGDVVPHGGRLETADGGAQLRSGGAVVELARHTAVTVVDGARQRLSEGAALVKATGGLTLASPALSVRVPKEGVARLDSGDVATVASYRGSLRVGVPGRAVSTVVPRLHQLELVAGSTPDAPSPLALRADGGDPWEQVELPTVVANDTALNAYATTFAQPGSPVVASLPADLRPARTRADVLADRAVAYALAAGRAGRYREALSYRAEGGSWGVVAALVQASSRDAESYVDALGGPDTSIVLADSAPDAEMVLPGLATAAPAAPVRPSASPTGAAPSPTSGTSPRPRPSTATSPSPAPGVVPQPVADVLAPVLDLLPVEVPLLPKPSPSASRPQVPVVGPLVDGLLTPSR